MDALISDIIIGTIAVVLFQYKNPQKDLIHWISAFTFVIIVANSFFVITDCEPAISIYTSISLIAGLAVSYFIRFRKKAERKVIDYIKWIGVFLIMLRPTVLFSFGEPLDSIFQTLGTITVPVLAAIYVYDRFILNHKP